MSVQTFAPISLEHVEIFYLLIGLLVLLHEVTKAISIHSHMATHGCLCHILRQHNQQLSLKTARQLKSQIHLYYRNYKMYEMNCCGTKLDKPTNEKMGMKIPLIQRYILW